MGDVYLAHDPTLGRDVAIKLLRDTDAGLTQEARALASLRHPAVVTIYEIGQHEGRDFIAMEYVRGRTLRAMFGRGTRDQLVAICAQVAVALAAAHRAGILHRDIKPENVIVDENGDVKVVDFGLARRLPGGDRDPAASGVVDQLRRTLPPEVRATLEMRAVPDTEPDMRLQTVYGTPAYMAPEVLVGAPSTEASDVYSLGVVLYEALAGRRPHDAQTVIEAIAWFVDNAPAPISDPLWPILQEMLANAPKERPRLDEIVTALAAPKVEPVVVVSIKPAPAPRRRWPLVLAVALATLAIGGGVVAWRLFAKPPAMTATIAVATLSVRIPSYGREQVSVGSMVDAFAQLFGEVEGNGKLTGVTVNGRSDAKSANATHVVVGTIEERDGAVYAEVEIVRVRDDKVMTHASAKRPLGELGALFDDVVVQLAGAVIEDARLVTPSRGRAEKFLRIGNELLRDGRITEARVYFEQAVAADPAVPDAWYGVAITRAWNEAPEALVLAAIDHTRTDARGGRAALADGVAAYMRMSFAESRRFLEPLDGAPDVDRTLWLYYLGESNWHDGRHAAGFELFEQALERDRRFTPASIHAWQYAVARRDARDATYYLGIAKTSTEWIDFATRRYPELAAGTGQFAAWSQIVLGKPGAALKDMQQRDTLDGAGFRIADAIDRDDHAAASRELATAWSRWVEKPGEGLPAVLFDLESIGEQMIAANMGDEARRIVTFLAAQSKEHPARGYHRLAILTAPLLGDATLLEHTGLSERNAKLADAARAELAGDRATAVTILSALVADPTFIWDYPERAALLRNLRSLGRTAEAAALCKQTLEPAVFRLAFTALRRACR